MSSKSTAEEEMVVVQDTTSQEDKAWSQKKKNKREVIMAPKPSVQKRKKNDGEDGGAKKKIRKKANPNALTPAFCNFIRIQLGEECKKVKANGSRALRTFAKFGKFVGARWRSMLLAEKASYEDGEDGGGKKKRKKKVKDPNAPKRALSAFIRFQLGERKRMKADPSQAPLSFTEVGMLLGEKWRNMSSSERAPYEAAAQVDKERYMKDMAQYKSGRRAGPVEPIESETHFDDE